MCFRRLLCVRIEIDQLLCNDSLLVGQLYDDKSLTLSARDLISITTNLLHSDSLLELIYFLGYTFISFIY